MSYYIFNFKYFFYTVQRIETNVILRLIYNKSLYKCAKT